MTESLSVGPCFLGAALSWKWIHERQCEAGGVALYQRVGNGVTD
jgi:hypothetical protein